MSDGMISSIKRATTLSLLLVFGAASYAQIKPAQEAPSARTTEAQSLYLRAGKQEREGKMDSAINIYKDLIERYPSSSWAVKANDRLLIINDRRSTGSAQPSRSEVNAKSREAEERSQYLGRKLTSAGEADDNANQRYSSLLSQYIDERCSSGSQSCASAQNERAVSASGRQQTKRILASVCDEVKLAASEPGFRMTSELKGGLRTYCGVQ